MLAALLLQSAAEFDLRRLERPARCGERRGADEIVVCRAPDEKYRVRELDGADLEEGRLKAEVGIGGNARLGVETEQAGINGFPSNRAMIRLKLPF
jgi:hypothetical protein